MLDPDVVDGAILSNAADHLHAVFWAPGRPARAIPANTNPATTLSNADPAGDLSGDSGTSGALRSVKRISQKTGNAHPSPFTPELVRNCLTAVDQGSVLDPFITSGTTAAVAEERGLDWV